MAYAMMGGILAATVLTLLFLPAAYGLFFRVKVPEAGKRGMPTTSPIGQSNLIDLHNALNAAE
jgi:hypothetical protein